MKHFIGQLPKKALAVAIAFTIVGGLAANAIASYGPDRTLKAWTQAEDGFDHVTFNSYTGVPNGIGNEPDFFRGVQVGDDANYVDPIQNIKPEAEIEGHIYIHNDADPNLNTVPDGNGGYKGVAKDVNVRVALPTGTAATQQATAYISASNASPTQIFDTLDLSGVNGNYISVAFVPGSAVLKNQDGSTSAVGDSLVTTGANIGDQNGCFKYVREVTFKLKVTIPRYTVSKVVRKQGEGPDAWRESVDAKVGDTIEWGIEFNNLGQNELKDVAIVDEVPAGLDVVPGSVVMYNGNYPNGYTYPANAVQANGRQVNVGIGNYLPLPQADQDAGNVSAQIIFATKVTAPGANTCGTAALTNKAYATPQGLGAVSDTAYANVTGDQCTTPTEPNYACTLLTLTKGDNRTVNAAVAYQADNGATFKLATFNFGDNSSPVVTNNTSNGKAVASHTYAADGTYLVRATITVEANGTKTTTSAACAQSVTFSTGTTITTTNTTTPTVLPNTGNGAATVAGLFAAVTVAGTFMYRFVLGRRYN